MSNGDWRSFAKQMGHAFDGTTVTVALANHRTQRVAIDEQRDGSTIRLWSAIASKTRLDKLGHDHPVEYAWERNRLSDLVGFTLDGKGRLIGETWIPTVEMTAEIFRLHVEEVARVCDWHEMRLSGDDSY